MKRNKNIPRAAPDLMGTAVKMLPKHPSLAVIRDRIKSSGDLTDLSVCSHHSCRNPEFFTVVSVLTQDLSRNYLLNNKLLN